MIQGYNFVNACLWDCEELLSPFLDLILNNNESNRMYFSVSVSTLLITVLEEGSLLCDRYKYISLKYELCQYPA